MTLPSAAGAVNAPTAESGPAAHDGALGARARRALPWTSAGRSRLAGLALAHPVRSILIVYLISRFISLAALWVAATWFQNPAGVGHHLPSVADLMPLWDTFWYRRIVEEGYPLPLPLDPRTDQPTYSAWAFYPLFPAIVKVLTLLGVPFIAAGVGLNLLLGGLAAVLVWKVLRFSEHADPQPARERLALVAACLWCFYPATAVMLKPYTEPLAVVLVAASILALMRQRYLLTAVLALPLGLTRGVAPAMGIVALVHLLVRVRQERAARPGGPPLAGQRASALVMLVATAVSGVLWPVVVGVSSGIPSAFFDVQKAWGMNPAGGPFVLWVEWAWQGHGLYGVFVLVALVATYVSLVLGRHGRWLTVEARAWALTYPIYLVAVVRPITSMWRFLLLDFPLAALVASVAMRTSTGAAVVPHWRRRVIVVLLVLVGGIFWWTCAFLVWTPWSSQPP